jgi:ComEC/Rec2-related protein
MRAPIYYALAPLLLGISVNSITHSSHGSLLISASLIVIVVILWRQKNKVLFIDDYVITGLILGCILSLYISTVHFYDTTQDKIPKFLQKLPQRELNICVKVKKVHSNYRKKKSNWISYRGIITAAPEVRNDLIGKTIFARYLKKNLSSFGEGDKLSFRGIIKYNDLKEMVNKPYDIYKHTNYMVFHDQIFTIEKEGEIGTLRNGIEKEISTNDFITKKCRGFLYAFIFGNRELLKEEQITLFRNTGTMHLFAVSGLHIGIAFFTVLQILKIIITRRTLLMPICLGVILFYVILVGSPASACRAYLMVFIWRLSILFCRKSNPISALGWAALILVAVKPEHLFSIGFQLSFTVVLTILWTIGNHSKIRGFSFIEYFKISFTVSYAAFCGSILLVVDNFHFINPVSILLNSILMGFVSIVFILCLIYIFAHAIYPSTLISSVIDYIYSVIEQLVLFFNSFEFSHTYFSLEFDIPDGIHLLWAFVLICTRNLFNRLLWKIVLLSCLPVCFLLLTLCLN